MKNLPLQSFQESAVRLFSTTAAALLMLALLGAGCGKHDAKSISTLPDLPSASVRVLTVEAKTHVATEEVVGTVRPKLRASIGAKVSGRIERMLVTQGQRVKAGELLAQLDSRENQSRLDQALAQRDQTESDFKRLTILVGQNAVTRQEFDATQARQLIAKAAVTQAETMLGYSQIEAPFDGVITHKLADVGDIAVPGRPLLELEDPTAMRLEADVPESLLGRIQTGAKMLVRLPALEREMSGTVSEIAPAADPNSRTFLVKLELPTAPDLRAGLFGRVAVPVAERSVLRVPSSAVVLRGQLEMLFVVNGGKAQLRLVKTGRRVGNEIELLSGLASGESVVVEGAASLTDGQPIEVRP